MVRYFQRSPDPLSYIRDGAVGDEGGAYRMARAALRAVQLSAQLMRVWRLSGALGLLRHGSPGVRWCAVRFTAHVFGLGDAALQALQQQVLAPEDALACAAAWDDERTAVAAEAAAMFLVAEPEGAALRAARPGSLAGERGGSPGGSGRKRKHETLASSAGGAGGASLSAASGYVEVCGLELPLRLATGSMDAGSRAHVSLVTTPAISRNLEAVALGEGCRGQAAEGTLNAVCLSFHVNPLFACLQGCAWRAQCWLRGPPAAARPPSWSTSQSSPATRQVRGWQEKREMLSFDATTGHAAHTLPACLYSIKQAWSGCTWTTRWTLRA